MATSIHILFCFVSLASANAAPATSCYDQTCEKSDRENPGSDAVSMLQSRPQISKLVLDQHGNKDKPKVVTCNTMGDDLEMEYSGNGEYNVTIKCESGCLTNGGDIWGTDDYTGDSRLCKSAIHAGQITNAGGVVSVYFKAGATSYSGSTRNGVSTKSFSNWWCCSFSFQATLTTATNMTTTTHTTTTIATTTITTAAFTTTETTTPTKVSTPPISSPETPISSPEDMATN